MPTLLSRLLVVFVFIGIGVGLVLLNWPAPGPTGRFYTFVPRSDGTAAEQRLAGDLGVRFNDSGRDSAEGLCVCKSETAPPSRCRDCFVTLDTVSSNRIPDFVTSDYIAEAKNQSQLLAGRDDLNQIRDFAAAAQATERRLWLYVRVDTEVDPAYTEAVRATGGDVVYYFADEGYVHPIDRTVQGILLFCAVSVISALALQVQAMQRYMEKPLPLSLPTSPPRRSPTGRAERAVRRAEQFKTTTEEQAQHLAGDDDRYKPL
jgi:hypothetical protein